MPSVDPHTETFYVCQFNDGSVWSELFMRDFAAKKWADDNEKEDGPIKVVPVRVVAIRAEGGST